MQFSSAFSSSTLFLSCSSSQSYQRISGEYLFSWKMPSFFSHSFFATDYAASSSRSFDIFCNLFFAANFTPRVISIPSSLLIEGTIAMM